MTWVSMRNVRFLLGMICVWLRDIRSWRLSRLMTSLECLPEDLPNTFLPSGVVDEGRGLTSPFNRWNRFLHYKDLGFHLNSLGDYSWFIDSFLNFGPWLWSLSVLVTIELVLEASAPSIGVVRVLGPPYKLHDCWPRKLLSLKAVYIN